MTSIAGRNPRVGAFMFLLCLLLLQVLAPHFSSGLEISDGLASTMAGSKAPLTLLKDLRVSSHQIPSFDRIPNTSVQKKPLLVYHSAFLAGTSASTMESHLKAVNIVEPQWRYTMYRSEIA